MQTRFNPTMWNIASTHKCNMHPAADPSLSSPLERHRAIWPSMGWREVINPTSRNAHACADCRHNFLTQFASCHSIFNGVRRQAAIQLLLVSILWHLGSSRIGSHN
ncbi:hypothetical protein O181_081641 [Austropuccinia psidii MF-1]|uniref:Uncharacterized protein n=1 Tax=Austropuccinia psidii MF-1 TaxID=1389203 RepID=A0A9Q3FR29_9BASI|nr:hypothetical protein [Austropuccinia psidii MF-1]